MLQGSGGDTIGHIELMNLDYDRRIALLGRVLIGNPKCHGLGYCKQMVETAICYGFGTIGVGTITLGVFDFNAQAIACYRALGFVEYERKPNAQRFGKEYWTLIMMRLDHDTWMKKNELRTTPRTLRRVPRRADAPRERPW